MTHASLHMIRRLAVVIAVGLLLRSEADSQDRKFMFNPGVRAGYYFGPNPGLFMGFDFSLTTYELHKGTAFGVYFSTEKRTDCTITHFGGEVFYQWFGASIGPAIIERGGQSRWGVSTTVFGGIVALPYVQAVYAAPDDVIHGFGLFVKLPIPMQKLDLDVGG